MSGEDFLGSFEQLDMLAVVRPGDDAYGMTVRREVEERTDRAVSLGAVYATLDRLENKGYLKSKKRKAGAKRQGKAKRLFEVKPSGLAALRNTLDCVERMRKGLPELGGAM